MLELKKVCKTYKTKKGVETLALNNVTLNFNNNKMHFILGKSGSGKSTLLNIIGGLDSYDSGDMLILDKNTKNFKTIDFDNYRNNYVGFIFQDFNIIEDYTVYENIVLALNLQNKKVDENEINNLLTKLGIIDYKTRKINELSGGQKQRVAIARALIKEPKIILADEPTGNLDSKTGVEIMNLLKEISKTTLVIIVSHNKEFAYNYGDRIIEIEDGKIIKDTFNEYDNECKENYKITKTRLPISDSLKLGFKSLNKRKMRLLLTLILISFSTIFLLLFYVINKYDSNSNHLKLLVDNSIDVIEIKKYDYTKSNMDSQTNKNMMDFTNSDISLIKKELKKDSYLVYSLRNESGLIEFLNLNIQNQENSFNKKIEAKNFYTSYAQKLQIIELNEKEQLIKEDLIGKFPDENDEIVISNYIADIIIENGIYEYNSNKVYYPKNYIELVNSNIIFSFGSINSVKIVGVIKYDLSKYEHLKNIYNNYKNIKNSDIALKEEFNDFNNSILNRVYTKMGFIDNLKTDEIINLSVDNQYILDINNKKINNSINAIINETEYYNKFKWIKTAKLAKNEALISIDSLLTKEEYEKYVSELNNYISKYPLEDKLTLEKKFIEKYTILNNYIGQKVNLEIYENTLLYSQTYNKKADVNYSDIKIIGITGLIYSNQTSDLFSLDILNNYINKYIIVEGYILRENSTSNMKNLINEFSYNNNFSVHTMYSDQIEKFNNKIIKIKPFIIMGMFIFLIFSILLISNFMFNSISNRKKDIGILKSLGAKNIDIIKIFISEGIFLSIISSILCILISLLIFNLLNSVILKTTYLSIRPFSFNAELGILTFLYIYVLVLVSSIMPLIKISKMKPINAINNR